VDRKRNSAIHIARANVWLGREQREMFDFACLGPTDINGLVRMLVALAGLGLPPNSVPMIQIVSA
jgi:hypothetical protein